MKKILSILSVIALLATLGNTVVFADDKIEIEGLHEKLSALFLANNFTEEQIADMNRQHIDEFNSMWPSILPGLKATGKMKTDSDEEEYTYRFNLQKLNFNNGVCVSIISARQYANEYMAQNVFSYLFQNTKYWSIPTLESSAENVRLTSDGKEIKYNESTNMFDELGANYSTFYANADDIEFIYNESNIENLLKQKHETSVSDIRFFSLADNISFLYIKCDKNEYLMPLFNKISYLRFENIKEKTLYSINEIMQAIIKDGKKNISLVKPTYETEATALQSAGLLEGNEKGLDLLKPLTRIEATTILVRAMGYEDAATATTSYFADIASDNWGAKYANIAYDKGIAEGIGDGLFAPNDTITASQFATLILRNLGESPDWRTAIDLFVERGLITSEQAEKMDLFTRGDMAKIIYEAKQKNLL